MNLKDRRNELEQAVAEIKQRLPRLTNVRDLVAECETTGIHIDPKQRSLLKKMEASHKSMNFTAFDELEPQLSASLAKNIADFERANVLYQENQQKIKKYSEKKKCDFANLGTKNTASYKKKKSGPVQEFLQEMTSIQFAIEQRIENFHAAQEALAKCRSELEQYKGIIYAVDLKTNYQEAIASTHPHR